MFDRLKENSREYYEKKLAAHGLTAQGVDWKDQDSQNLRFRILSEIGNLGGKRVHDVGCGLGHLLLYFRERNVDCDYVGSDISPVMIENATRICEEGEFHTGDVLEDPAPSWMKVDFVLASGIFHVRSDIPYHEWHVFVEAMIRRMFDLAEIGIGFNLLTSYVDYEEPYLFYCPPKEMLDFCMKNLSRRVVVRHDYPLYEYTVYVYK